MGLGGYTIFINAFVWEGLGIHVKFLIGQLGPRQVHISQERAAAVAPRSSYVPANGRMLTSELALKDGNPNPHRSTCDTVCGAPTINATIVSQYDNFCGLNLNVCRSINC